MGKPEIKCFLLSSTFCFPSVAYCIFPEWKMSSFRWGGIPVHPRIAMVAVTLTPNGRYELEYYGWWNGWVFTLCCKNSFELQKISELRKCLTSGRAGLERRQWWGAAEGAAWQERGAAAGGSDAARKDGEPISESSGSPQRKTKALKAKMGQSRSSSMLAMVGKI